ncbi:hypothetical protein Tco_0624918 [Tanacetum coccineum]|uniref:Uncharacterized protein n=1 Tax=Tanacetum coccineum TaxID=301880 RepID=A0ABQ4WFA9_9ASTR
MSTQQNIYAAGSENCPPMLNKDNYVPWSSRLLRYAKSRLNGKLIYNSIINGPYVRRMIPEPGDPDRKVLVAKTFYEQTDDELTEKEEIWLRVQQMMKGFDVGLQEKKAKLFNKWENFASTDRESITKDLNTVDYTQLYDFLKYNEVEVNELRAERLAKSHDPLALMANSHNLYDNLSPGGELPGGELPGGELPGGDFPGGKLPGGGLPK